MTRFGYFLSCEEHEPRELVRQARLAEQAGFDRLWISDHFHPWLDAQGQSPFVWSVIGAVSQAVSLPITTAVTCPLVRMHPAIVAQAAATSACLTDFRLGVGTGEALNEHVVNAAWPPHAVRLEMLEEAVEVMRRLWTGELVTHRGEHYEVDTARLYTLPDKPPQVFVSGFGEKSVELAGRIGDGYVCTAPSADLVKEFHEAGGHGKPVMGGFKACYDLDPDKARATIHRIWPNQGIKGEASQLLPLPRHFEQLSEMVDEAAAVDGSPCGPDPRTHLEVCREYAAAGFDEVYVAQVGPEQDAFFDFYARHVLPELS